MGLRLDFADIEDGKSPTRGHRERNLLDTLRPVRYSVVRVEVIGHLSEHARPVDRVDGAQADLVAELSVHERSLPDEGGGGGSELLDREA